MLAAYRRGALPCRAMARLMSSAGKPRKPGVATDAELAAFFDANDAAHMIVVDARNPDFAVEPGDERSAAKGALAGTEGRTGARAINLVYDRENKTMDLAALEPFLVADKDTPIITHCGGGGRGQKAKDFLKANGFTNVLNGGGPSVAEHWEKFGKL